MNFIINKTKALISVIITVFFGGFGIYYLLHRMCPELLVFLAIAIIFGFIFCRNASSLFIDRQAVTLSFFGIQRRQIPWSNIKEMGLISENVFSRKKGKNEDIYIYFSPYEMTEKERFEMIVKWPPKDILYMEYGEKGLEYTMSIWGRELKTYNVKDLYPVEKLP